MNKKQAMVIQMAVLVILISPAYAQLGAQSFPTLNFDDSIPTDAELDVAQTTFSDSGILPDNPLYFFKRFGEATALLFTFGENDKAKLHLNFAKIRLAEARQMIGKNKTDGAKEPLHEYEKELDAMSSSDAVKKNQSVAKDYEDVLHKSKLLLSIEMSKVPEQAKQELENALNISIEKDALIYSEGGNMKNMLEKEQDKNWRLMQLIRIENDKAQQQINETLQSLEEINQRIANATENQTTLNLLKLAQQKFEMSRDAYKDARFGEAFGLANAAGHLSENVAKMMKKHTEGNETANHNDTRNETEHMNDTRPGNVMEHGNDMGPGNFTEYNNTMEHENIITGHISGGVMEHNNIGNIIEHSSIMDHESSNTEQIKELKIPDN